jgi:adenosine deaminase
MNIESQLVRMPKVELHVHLEGTFRPATLLSLARKNRVDLPADDVDGIRRWFRFKDFEHFVQIYVLCSRCLRDPEDFHVLALDFLAEQAIQNVLYSEVHFTISTHLWNGLDGEGIRQALREAAEDGERRHGIAMKLIPDIVRNMEIERADATLRWAVDGKKDGVVALGMGGIEQGYENEPFRRHYETAAQEGLHRVAHAGETGGPDSVRSVLDVCGAERIGHGVHAIDDPALMAELRQKQIPLEVCPSSNVALGIYPSIAEHPVKKLIDAGLCVTINSDDPPLFGTNLTREYLHLHRTFGLSAAELAQLSWNGLRHAFLDGGERQALEGRFREGMSEVGISNFE